MGVLNPSYLRGFDVSTRSTDGTSGTKIDKEIAHTYGDSQLVPGVLTVLMVLKVISYIGKYQLHWPLSLICSAFFAHPCRNQRIQDSCQCVVFAWLIRGAFTCHLNVRLLSRNFSSADVGPVSKFTITAWPGINSE